MSQLHQYTMKAFCYLCRLISTPLAFSAERCSCRTLPSAPTADLVLQLPLHAPLLLTQQPPCPAQRLQSASRAHLSLLSHFDPHHGASQIEPHHVPRECPMTRASASVSSQRTSDVARLATQIKDPKISLPFYTETLGMEIRA